MSMRIMVGDKPSDDLSLTEEEIKNFYHDQHTVLLKIVDDPYVSLLLQVIYSRVCDNNVHNFKDTYNGLTL